MSITSTSYFKPTSITGCRMWLDADDPTGTGVLPSNGATVSTWVDKSGNGFNATAVVGTGQGSVPLTATATISSRGVLFSGNQTFSTTLNSMMNLQSIFIIMSVNSTDYIDTVSTSSPSSDSGLQIITSSLSQVVTRFGGTIVTGSSVAQNTIFMNEIFFTGGGTTTLYLNGTQSGTANNSPTLVNAGTVAIGAYQDAGGWAELFIGKIFEVIIYNVVLGSTDRKNVEAYLAQKWGLTSSLPSGHIGLMNKLYASSSPAIKVTPYTSVSYAFAPTQITGCQLWLDAQDNSTISLTSGYVSAVTDKALGTSFTSTGPTPANLTVASASINSYQSFYFNNAAGNYVGLHGNLAQLTTGTAIFVMKYLSTQNGAWRPIFGWNDNGSTQSIAYGTNLSGTGVAGPYIENIGYNGSATATLTNNGLYIVTFTFTGTTTGVGYNGQISLTAGTVSSYSGSGTSIGICTEASGTQNTNVYLGEIIIYNTVLGSTDRQKVESYLAQKWGVQSSLAATHPGLTTNYFLHPYITNRGAITTLSPASKIPINLTGLIIYYSFDNAIYDLYNVASLNLTGSISYVTGRRGQALSLTNTAAVAPTNYLSSSYVLPSTFTVSLWFQTPNTSVGSMVFCAASNISLVTGSISIYFSSGYLGCAYSDIANNGLAYAISANTWYHAAITYNSGSMLLYVNGSLSGNTVTGTNSKSGFTLGGGRDTLTQYPFTGYIDDLRIYNRILTGSELTAIYNGLA